MLAGLLALLVTGSASAAAPEPVVVGLPQIAGAAVVGSQLTASAGRWTPAAGTPSYEWRRCDAAGANCAAISGATQLAYTVALDDVGHTLALQLVVTHNGGTSAPAQSGPTLVVPPVPPAVVLPPAIAGTIREGETLTAQPGEWSGSAPLEFSYGWVRCDPVGAGCVALGAESATYTLTAADVGHSVRFVVTASNGAGSATAGSDPTPVVAPRGAPAPTLFALPSASPPAPPASAPAPAASTPAVAGAVTRRRLMTPFPVVRIAGRVSGRRTILTLVSVKAPAGARIDVACRKPRCALRIRVRRRAALRIHRLERTFAPGTVISVRVTAAGVIGKYTRLITRTGRAPARLDRCLTTRSGKPVRCPAG